MPWNGKPYWSVHTHSRFSINDAMPHVETLVDHALDLGYPALGLTDHGNITGSVALYNACRKAGIEPLPGIELYVTDDSELGRRAYNHLTVVAYSETGYRNLCRLATLTNRKFHFKPRIDMVDFADLADHSRLDGLAVSTGCFFGVVQQRLITRGEMAARRVIDYLASLFPRCYVELQHHGIDNHDSEEFGTDDDIVQALRGLAYDLGLPTIIAQDSHYTDLSEQPLHDMLKTLVSWSDDVDDAKFPGDGFHLVDGDYLLNYFTPNELEEATDGLDDLYRAARVRIPELETFQMKVPDVTLTGDPQSELEQRCIAALKEWKPEEKPDGPYWTRLSDEFEIIDFSDSAGLIMVAAKVTDFMRASKIWFGARGSASSSLALKLLGITRLDPIERGLDMTRFLSKDRTKPPDIDLDVEHARRHEVMAFCEQNFTIAQVGTLMTYSLFDDDEDVDNAKGSLMQRYHTVRNKRGLPRLAWKDVPPADKEALETLAKMELISGYGTHAAGIILAPDEATLAQLPLGYIASSKTVISAYNKKDVEKLGFVKLDLLGLRDMTAMRIAMETLGITDQDEVHDFVDWGDKAVMKRIRDGNTEGVFQLQGFSMMKGCQRLQPKDLEDLAVAQALFRPAATQSGMTADYLARRKGKMKLVDRHEDIMGVTKDTYGVLLYQEQMVEVLRRLGLPPDELTEMLDAVKASNKYSIGAKATIEAMLPKIQGFASERGWDGADIQWLTDALVAFAEYSFNKAHASEYADRAYISAWLATRHPQSFWVGLLNAYRGSKKEPLLVRAAREYSVRIRPPHVNLSQVEPIIDPSGSGIRKGLVSVKKVGEIVANEIVKARADKPFASLKDFGMRVNNSKVSGSTKLALGEDPRDCGGVVEALNDAGALEGLT